MDETEIRARLRDLIRKAVENDPVLGEDPWAMADRVLALWAMAYPDQKDAVNEDHVFEAAVELGMHKEQMKEPS